MAISWSKTCRGEVRGRMSPAATLASISWTFTRMSPGLLRTLRAVPYPVEPWLLPFAGPVRLTDGKDQRARNYLGTSLLARPSPRAIVRAPGKAIAPTCGSILRATACAAWEGARPTAPGRPLIDAAPAKAKVVPRVTTPPTVLLKLSLGEKVFEFKVSSSLRPSTMSLVPVTSPAVQSGCHHGLNRRIQIRESSAAGNSIIISRRRVTD